MMELDDENKPAQKKEPVTVKLLYPVKHGAEEITEVTIKPPKGKHLRKYVRQNMSFDDMLNLAGKLSGVSAVVFDEMEAEDCGSVVEAVGKLL
jgi:hypothetical protein